MEKIFWMLFSFSGRLTLRQFWQANLWVFLVAILLSYFNWMAGHFNKSFLLSITHEMLAAIMDHPEEFMFLFYLFSPVIAFLCWTQIAILAKRLHDLNLSAWYMLPLFGLSIIGNYLSVQLEMSSWLLVAFFIQLIPGIVPGSSEKNRYSSEKN